MKLYRDFFKRGDRFYRGIVRVGCVIADIVDRYYLAALRKQRSRSIFPAGASG